MPMQVQHQWREYVNCSVCSSIFNENQHPPVSLVCGHTVCKACLMKFNQKKCPVDQTAFNHCIDELPVNYAILQLVGVSPPNHTEQAVANRLGHQRELYADVRKTVEELALFLKPPHTGGLVSTISLPMQRKLFTIVTCQLVEEEGQVKIMRAARSLGERAVTELLLVHQNPQQLAPNLWAAVRNRGCQFLGPAMQEEVLKLILLAQEEGHPLSRKVLVLFVVQRLEPHYSQASKTAIGHVVQLLYRASCFKVMKRDEESSLMQLKEEFRTYETLRREHDTQIVQIALEAGLRITPDQWSSLLYGDSTHKSHMQSIIDKLQTAQSFSQSVSELMMALQRSGDPTSLSALQPHLELLTNIDLSHDGRVVPSWDMLKQIMSAVLQLMQGFDEFMQQRNAQRQDMLTAQSPKYKTSLCRDLQVKGKCPRGNTCSFAHTQEELERYRTRTKLFGLHPLHLARAPTSSALTPQETAELAAITKATQEKLKVRGQETELRSGGSSGDLPSAARMSAGRNSRFDITAVTQGQSLLAADSFQQQQAYAQRVLRQGHRRPSGGELTQYYQTQGAMHGGQQAYSTGSEGLHGIFGRGDYTEPVGSYKTWHPNGSNLPRGALSDLFPTLANSGIQSQSADRVHGNSSLHLNDLLRHQLDRLPESQDASPVKSVNMASFDSGWNMPTSGSHASFFTGDDHQRSLSPQHDNISDDSGLDIDRHYYTWSSDDSHVRPSILPKDRTGFHPTSTVRTDVNRIGRMLEGKDDFIPWDECGGPFGPITRCAKSDKFAPPSIMESVSGSSNGFSQVGMGGNARTSPSYEHMFTLSNLDRTSANVYPPAAANYMEDWSSSRTRSDSMPSNLRIRPSQQQQQQSSFIDQFQTLQLSRQNTLGAGAGVTSVFPDLVPMEFGTYGFQQQLSQALEKQQPPTVYSVPEMSALTMQSMKHQADHSFMH